MKKIATFIVGLMIAVSAMAEATFDQIEGLIQQQNYSAAAAGLEVIIQNHPKSAKAFYAMAQAQAGLGNLEKANKALNIATGLNPTLDFAPASSVSSLKQAITPQTAKIETIEESHFGRNIVLLGMFILFAVAMYFLYSVYARKRDEDEGKFGSGTPSPITPTSPSNGSAKVESTIKQDYANSYTPRAAYQGPIRSTSTPAPVTPAPAPVYQTPPSHTTVVNNSSGNDLLTGVIIGNMMSGSHHHDTERTVVRETVREVPAPSRDSSWDDTPAPSSRSSRSSSWDDTPAEKPSRSSSWDDDSSSSSKSSSSWSSSSDSSSSSSWDSGSSSSDSGSSSSWD